MLKNYKEQGLQKLETPGVTLSETARSGLCGLKGLGSWPNLTQEEWDRHFLKQSKVFAKKGFLKSVFVLNRAALKIQHWFLKTKHAPFFASFPNVGSKRNHFNYSPPSTSIETDRLPRTSAPQPMQQPKSPEASKRDKSIYEKSQSKEKFVPVRSISIKAQ